MSMFVFSLDIGNAFQNTLVPVLQRVYVRYPPFYIQWFREMYPKIPLPPIKTYYVLQAVHAIQGSRTADNEWFELSSQIFQQMVICCFHFSFRERDTFLIIKC